MSRSNLRGFHDASFVGRLSGVLQSGGKLLVQEAVSATQDTLQQQVLLGGLTDIRACPDFASLPPGSMGQLLTVEATRPSWESGARSAISLKPKAKVPNGTANGVHSAQSPTQAHSNGTATDKHKIWSLPVSADDELMDEDELLTEEDRQRPEVPSGAACPPTKKACANCSCGRAEAEAAGVKADLTPDMLDNPQSACGSCGLGDAFRCSTCPYRGLPKFKTGEKIALSSDFLTADA
ncbi:hypothetical protein WJX73_007288 [Symbiochloris irregularis]|uniref:Anamorsin homolog n=1 Tax=Symbiochloris irregularis TaxID=706552 RepID=A0AAW1PHU4_9CHLO